MFYALTRREELLHLLPKGGIGAEIGVADGDFSQAILDAAAPQELHLIDPWSHLEEGSDLLAGAEVLASQAGATSEAVPENPEGAKQYDKVVARFNAEPRVQVRRQYSYKIAPQYADGFFDFVYLDGNHTYEFVLRDLIDFSAKLKPGGLMFGHDYFEDAFARQEHYGVIDAVSTFLKRSNFRFLMLTWEPFSTFCITDRLDGFAGKFLQNALNSDLNMIELPEVLAPNYRDKTFGRQNGTKKRIPSFTDSGAFQLR